MLTSVRYSELGYSNVRVFNDGRVAGLMRFVHTVGLCVGIEDDGSYLLRYCYASYSEAAIALLQWNGDSDPPGRWIKKKGNGFDELGPGAILGGRDVLDGGF